MRSRRPRASSYALFTAVLAAVLVSSLVLASKAYLNLPRRVRVLPGQEYSLPSSFWFRAVLPGRPRGQAERSGEPFLARTVPQTVWLPPTGPSSVDLEWRLLGLVPVGSLEVRSVPEVAVIPGGQAIGVVMNSGGLLVTRVGPVIDVHGRRRFPAEEADIRPGDLIVEVNGQTPQTPSQVARLVQQAGQRGSSVRVKLRRAGTTLETQIQPVPIFDERVGRQRYLLGLYLQDPVAGVGTLTFYHPETLRYGALGHMVTDGFREPMGVSEGRIVEASIQGVQPGARGRPGEKIGSFAQGARQLGTIDKNNTYGIFGHLFTEPSFSWADRQPVPVAMAHQVKPGPAQMLTVVEGNRVEAFDIEILRVYPQGRQDGRGMVLRIVDPRLLALTEGIVQGMSGSPILQDGKLVGAVTHVFVNDPQRGYGTMAEWMVYEAGILDDTWEAPGVPDVQEQRQAG